jgi:hypothetical protein
VFRLKQVTGDLRFLDAGQFFPGKIIGNHRTTSRAVAGTVMIAG